MHLDESQLTHAIRYNTQVAIRLYPHFPLTATKMMQALGTNPVAQRVVTDALNYHMEMNNGQK